MNKEKAAINGDDVLQTYFNQIKDTPLLSFEDELELSKRIQGGDKDAHKKLVEANLRLVVKIARAFLGPDISYMDIIQEGNLGLIRAAEKYDYRKNVRFSTYAAWWVRQYIGRFLANYRRTIRLPHRKEEILRRIQRSYHHLSQILMRQPRPAEIAKEIGVPVEDVELILHMTNNLLPLEMDDSREEAAGTLELHGDYTYSPERALLRKSSRDETLRFLNRLKEREKRILTYRYQLNGGEQYTLKKIGDKMGISAETVRQIEIRALRKIRPHVEELRNCLYAM
jgi:RNA polymerase primary sigma factor